MSKRLFKTFKPSKWYTGDLAKDKAAETRARTADHTRATAANDARAVAYALWLMRRDGIDLAALTAESIAAHNAKFPVTSHKYRGATFTARTGNTLREDDTPTARVLYQPTSEGLRAHKVVWSFKYPNVPVLEFELPHWAYVCPAVVEHRDEALAA